MPTSSQLQFLSSLLQILAYDHKAEVDSDTGSVRITREAMGSSSRLDCGLTIDPSEEDDGKWTVNALVMSGGSYDCPPDVDIVEVEPPSPWEVACAALVRHIVAKFLDDALSFSAEADYYALEEEEEDESCASMTVDDEGGYLFFENEQGYRAFEAKQLAHLITEEEEYY